MNKQMNDDKTKFSVDIDSRHAPIIEKVMKATNTTLEECVERIIVEGIIAIAFSIPE